MTKVKLLEARKQTKSRKPTFKRVQSNQFAKLRNKGNSWRKPKGMGNKVRRNRRGQASMPTVGYGSPKEVRGLNRAGYKEVIVSNLADLSKVDVKDSAVVISATVGAKKKLAILEEAKKLKLVVSNFKDIDAKIKELTKTKKAPKKEKVVETKSEETKKDKSSSKKEESKK